MRLTAVAYPSGNLTAHGAERGMFLRDYFAIRFAAQVHPENVTMPPPEREKLANYAYELADAMLAARE